MRRRPWPFIRRGLGRLSVIRIPDSDPAKVKHSEIQIGDSAFMLSSEYKGWGSAPKVGEGTCFTLYVPDCDAAFAQALAAGASVIEECQDQFWGDRTGIVADPHGYRWALAQRVREVPFEEILAGAEAWDPEAK